jgi:uncharacterized protein (TIGR02266 family)
LLREALLGMQEDALGREDGPVRMRMLQLAEQIADVTGELFEAERAEDPEPGALQRIRASLREILGFLQQAELRKTAATAAMGPVARALAVVFAACGDDAGGREEDVVEAAAPPKKRKGLVLVDSGDDWDKVDAAVQPTAEIRSLKDERRANERVSLSVDIGFVSESNFYAGLTMDVSAGGLFVATYQRVPVGTVVELSFFLPDGTSVTTTGEVRWTREPSSEESTPGIGVAFSSLTEEDLDAIARFCSSRAPMYVDLADE